MSQQDPGTPPPRPPRPAQPPEPSAPPPRPPQYTDPGAPPPIPPQQRPDGSPVGSPLPPMDISAAPTSQRDRRSVSRFAWLGAVCTVLATIGLAVAVYQFVATIDVFGFLVADRHLFSAFALVATVLLCLLALVAVVAAIVGTVRSRYRAVGVVVLIAALVMPTVAGVSAGIYGGSVLKERTIAQAQEYASQISPEQIDEFYDMVEGFGVELPGREELKGIVEKGQGVLDGGASDGGGSSDSGGAQDEGGDGTDDGDG